MNLKANGKIDLEHRAYFLEGRPSRTAVVVAAKSGEVSLIDPDFVRASRLHVPSDIQAISQNPKGGSFAWINADGLLIEQTFDGRVRAKITPAQLRSEWKKQPFKNCCFDDSGQYLWLVVRLSAEAWAVAMMETNSWALIDALCLEDPFVDSFCSFHNTGKHDLIALWLAAGQDGQQVYFLTSKDRRISCTIEPRLKNTVPPVFAPSTEKLAVLDENRAISQFSFPGMQRIGLPLSPEQQDNPFVESVAFLNEEQMLASTHLGRIFVINAERMTIEDELVLEEHEPRPIGHYYPKLARMNMPGTDISYFRRLGNVIFFVYRRDKGTSLSGWKDSILWLSVKQ